MTSRLTLSALGERLARPQRSLRNRLMAHRARLGGRPVLAATLPEPVRFGDAARGEALIAGSWRVLDRSLDLHEDGIWAIPVADPRLEVERQSFIWLEDLAALGNRAARSLAQDWVTDWIRRYGHGRGAGWTPALAGRRLQAWTMHGRLLAEGLAPPAADALWRAFAAQQRYLAHTWLDAPEGMPGSRPSPGSSGRALRCRIPAIGWRSPSSASRPRRSSIWRARRRAARRPTSPMP